METSGDVMRGCHHPGIRVIVPPNCLSSPTLITCQYVNSQESPQLPKLMEGQALASRLLELQPVGVKFLEPVLIEVSHFASLRDKQREVFVLRSENGEIWTEHRRLKGSEEAIQDILQHSNDGEILSQAEDLYTNRIVRILTKDFPQYFALVSRIRQETYAVGPAGGTITSSVIPSVQAVFPPNALTKKIVIGLQAQEIEPELVAKLLGHKVTVSPIVTVQPCRRKFHKAITLKIPPPSTLFQSMINKYFGTGPTLRFLCSITDGENKADWKDVTGSTKLTILKDCVSFTTLVSAQFWLMYCYSESDAAKMATDLYNQAVLVPLMVKFVVLARRVSVRETRVKIFCVTDDEDERELAEQEHFTEIGKSIDIEVLENENIFLEFSGNLLPISESDNEPQLCFKAIKNKMLAFIVRLHDPYDEPIGKVIFMTYSKTTTGEPIQTPLSTLNLSLPKNIFPDGHA